MPWGKLIGLALGGYNAWQSGKQQGKADQLQREGLAMAQRQYADRAPFRAQAEAMLPGIEQDSGLPADFGMARGNPYSRGTRTSTAMNLVPIDPQQVKAQEQARTDLMEMDRLASSVKRLPLGMGERARQQVEQQRQRLIPLTGRAP